MEEIRDVALSKKNININIFLSSPGLRFNGGNKNVRENVNFC
jgi:hypothetical protein